MLYLVWQGCYTASNGDYNPLEHGSISIFACRRLGSGRRAGTLSGAVLGALAVNLLYNYFTSQHDFYFFSWNPDYWQILLGLMFVLVVLYLPNGLIGVLDKLRGSIDFKERKTRS